ncbi:MAG: hypothetical protein QF473_11975 [Planctomycetota bacterium]|jgi:hypothetical protein|nr:hypothetical protein [Planctomycetota bacterium]
MNLLQNGALELDSIGVPGHWTLAPREAGNQTRVSAASIHGLECLKIKSPARVDDWEKEGVMLTQTVLTKPDTVYTLSLRMHNRDFRTGDGSAYLFGECNPEEDAEPDRRMRIWDPPENGFVRREFVFRTGKYWRHTFVKIFTRYHMGTLFIGDVRLIKGGAFDPGPWDKPVPRDHLLLAGHTFDRPALEEMKCRFMELHDESEEMYLGDGQWRTSTADSETPLRIRSSSQRVFAYLGAHEVMPEPVFLDRARATCDFLVSIQKPDGTIDDPFYETGLGGAALVEGYLHFKDRRYLAAAERVAQYVSAAEPHPWNYNYNTFLVWAAARYAKVAGRLDLIEPQFNTRMLAWPLEHQCAWGGWAGHNSRMGYHGVNLRAFAALYDALQDEPECASLRGRLMEASIASVNRMIVEQCADGGLPFNHGQPETARAVSSPAHALIKTHEIMGIDTSNLLFGLMSFYGTPMARENFDDPKLLVLAVQHSIGMYLAWAAKNASATDGCT